MKKTEGRFWDKYDSWHSAEAAWDKKADLLKSTYPLKGIRHWRDLPGIRTATRKKPALEGIQIFH